MKLCILRNSAAEEALSCHEFTRQWNQLFLSCAWATVFQKADFSRVWFENYGETYSPVLFFLRDQAGDLTHLLCLAQHKSSKNLVPCGAEQADYQCWLSIGDNFQVFLVEVLNAIRKISSQNTLRLKFIPPLLLSVIKNNSSSLAMICKPDERPLVCFGTDPVPWQSLDKKSNKSKISRLRREGEVQLLLDDFHGNADELDSELRTLALDYDLRQGAINDTMPFMEDASKFKFHRELLLNTDSFKLLKLTVNSRVVAAIFGAESDRKFTVCVFSYSALMAKHSPGKLLILMGARMLAEQGLEAIDLTPGGEWKSRFANAHEDVADCSLYLSRGAYYRFLLFDRAVRCAKSLLVKAGLDRRQLSNVIQNFRNYGTADVLEKVRRRFRTKKRVEYRIYKYDAQAAPAYEDEPALRRNAIEDLLQFQAVEPWQNLGEFLRSSSFRLEQGEICYTKSDNGRLVHYGWMIPSQNRSYFTEVEKEYSYPEPGCVLYDFYTHPEERGKGHYSNSLRQMLADATKDSSIRTVYISVLADNVPSRHVIEKVGFEYVESLFN